MAGPDLKGVTQRRSPDWLKAWLKSPDTMVMSDSMAKALYKEYHQVKMPNLKLSDEEIAALIAYMDEASGGGPAAAPAPSKGMSKSSKKS
jgi:protein SCO1/2